MNLLNLINLQLVLPSFANIFVISLCLGFLINIQTFNVIRTKL
jgi:hypothetical protein